MWWTLVSHRWIVKWNEEGAQTAYWFVGIPLIMCLSLNVLVVNCKDYLMHCIIEPLLVSTRLHMSCSHAGCFTWTVTWWWRNINPENPHRFHMKQHGQPFHFFLKDGALGREKDIVLCFSAVGDVRRRGGKTVRWWVLFPNSMGQEASFISIKCQSLSGLYLL